MSDKSKLVYICSPYATGDVQENVEKAKEYCKLALKEGFVPVAAHLLYPQFLCDEDEAEREKGFYCGLALLDVCAEVWVFGNPDRSEGMLREIEYARNRKKKVVFMDLKEYILREDALNIPFTSVINEDGISYVPLRDITRHLRNLPGADVRKISHGKWIDKFCGEFRCNVCGEITSIDTETDFPNGMRYRFCPWCGAEMNMEDNE